MESERHKHKPWRYIFNFFLTFNTIKQLSFGLFFFISYTSILSILHLHILEEGYSITNMIHSILGLALGLLLVFRTNTAYDRWWEGRKLLGALVNDSRNLALKVESLYKNSSEKRYMGRMIAAYCFSLKAHLRDEDSTKVCLNLLTETELNQLEKQKHQPNLIAKWMYRLAYQKHEKGQLSEVQLLTLNEHLQAFTDIIGGCERIKKTPMPFAYSIHLRQFLNLYFVTLPFVLIPELGYWAILLIALIYYALAGLRVIGEEIEEPFGTDENDLPVEAICHTIFNNIHEILEIEKPTEESLKFTFLEEVGQ